MDHLILKMYTSLVNDRGSMIFSISAPTKAAMQNLVTPVDYDAFRLHEYAFKIVLLHVIERNSTLEFLDFAAKTKRKTN